MKGITSLFLGIFGTFVFSWVGLILVPNYQIGHLNPQTDEEGNDPYPIPRSGMAERGRQIYAANGCVYCHSQQVRADYAGSDIERKWGERRSAPRDYLFDRPVVLGKMRVGPDLSNIGKRAPAEPESTPAAERVSPFGNVPDGWVKVYCPVPPTPRIVWLYRTPILPFGNIEFDISNPTESLVLKPNGPTSTRVPLLGGFCM